MGQFDQQAVDLFKTKAKLVSIEISELANLSDAIERAVEICAAQKINRIPIDSAKGEEQNILAAPALSDDDFKIIFEAGEKKGLKVIRDGLRERLDGIESAFTIAELGIADTATTVMNSLSEELRLATMVCETHIIALAKSKIIMDSYQAEDYLRTLLGENAMYAAFISGASRTADIERVLTIGVHGPVEMHVLLLNDVCDEEEINSLPSRDASESKTLL